MLSNAITSASGIANLLSIRIAALQCLPEARAGELADQDDPPLNGSHCSTVGIMALKLAVTGA